MKRSEQFEEQHLRRCDHPSRFPDRVRAAWAELLTRWSWEWFCTLTFSNPRVHPERANKAFRVWLAIANRTLFGRRWHKRGEGVTWARGLELQQRGTIHFHVLVAGVADLRRLTMMDEWARLAGWARIRPVESQERVARYVAKYVAKGGEIDLGGPGLVLEQECQTKLL